MSIPYRHQRTLKRIGTVLAALILVFAVTWLCWVVWLQRYVIYTDDGAELNFSLSSYDKGTRDFWVDTREDIIFVKDDIVIDTVPLAEIPAFMESISNAQNHCFHYVLVHEQYFYEDYERYEPDYRERVFAAVDWCHRHGYRPVTMTSIINEISPDKC